jgi:hypothetical protein
VIARTVGGLAWHDGCTAKQQTGLLSATAAISDSGRKSPFAVISPSPGVVLGPLRTKQCLCAGQIAQPHHCLEFGLVALYRNLFAAI